MRDAPLSRTHLPRVIDHVEGLYAEFPPDYHYHTIAHTREVVRAAVLIATEEGMTGREQVLVEVAAWFHDVGYPRMLDAHEELSAFRSLLVLTRMGISFKDIELIEGCILVTTLGSEPRNALEAVLADADMIHLTMDDFWEWSTRLRREWEATRNLYMTDTDWVLNNIRFMRSVRFRTRFGQRVLMPRLEANIAILEGLLVEEE
jgi:predicted metal-dependent HD superfamily phosphohydrolase